MGRLIKVRMLSDSGSEVREMTVLEATQIIRDSYARGNVVFDKEQGRVIDEITANVREIVVMQLVAGG